MQTVRNFLFFFELETGGKIIGFIKFSAGLALMVLSAVWFGRSAAIVAKTDLDDFKERESNHLMALTSLVLMLICFWVIFSSFELIQGCRQVITTK